MGARTYFLNRICQICGIKVSDQAKYSYCVSHRADNPEYTNPMQGKSLYSIWLEKYGEEEAIQRQTRYSKNLGRSSKEKWKKLEYRKKIYDRTKGKKRSLEFRKKQSKNAVKQMKDPTQLKIRSDAAKQSYYNGSLTTEYMSGTIFSSCKGYTSAGYFYASKAEKRRIEFLIESKANWKRYEVGDLPIRLMYEWNGKQHQYLPDFVIKIGDAVIVEEIKSNVKKISELEKHKANIAKHQLEQLGIHYRMIDDSCNPIDLY